MPRNAAYEPVSVKAVLAEMKDTAELLIDLSYSAVLTGSDDIAREVLDLEDRVDLLQLQGRMSLLMAARSPEDAEQLAPVLGVMGAAEKISDAAGDIAKIVLDDIGTPDALRAALPEAVEALVRARLASDATYVGQTLAEINMETESGVRVLAIRRESATGKRRWLLNPGPETELQADDSLLLRGSHDGVRTVYETVTGGTYELPAAAAPPTGDLERAVDSIILMKDMSELAVDLAYGAMLFDSEGVAEEVLELEAEVDALKSRFEAWILRAGARVEDPVQLRGLVHLASATEVISDAAVEISEGVLRGIDAHPVVAAAIEESDEVIVRLSVAPGVALAGATLGGEDVKTRTGMRVIAVRRGDDDAEWVVQPGSSTALRGGDTIIAKGTRAGAERLGELVGDEREFET
jgi:uncharacterized protein with PhoU and TrkA domain